MKKVLILGSSGSIGVNSLNVIRNFPDRFSVEALTVNSNIDLLEQQINEFSPSVVVVTDEKKADELKKRIGKKVKVLSGNEGLLEAASTCDYEILVSSLVGFAGFFQQLKQLKRVNELLWQIKKLLLLPVNLLLPL
jgi:1-deoxy-D-xylulose-5-phosphate reductoisomerase